MGFCFRNINAVATPYKQKTPGEGMFSTILILAKIINQKYQSDHHSLNLNNIG